ncbi:FecR family protein [Rubellicoccus peritrichatus]|uniref:FecR domain-containing protein n=1 Tax=Rubellicoccus peritrichatus TaxID=3080537 RepID=A0AAQ3L936_9BACT|nr:FecR domain-containing protein [Puniceicoccus sp. CR14]WOO41096.1 FecR domain-containing protein [Puniceicoccus sp. CR14]
MNIIRKILSTLAVTVLFTAVAQAQISEGTVKVFTVKGNVSLIDIETKKAEPLRRGMEFSAGKMVSTGENSTALLLFSNGAAVNVSEKSTVSVDQFIQAKFDPQLGSYLRLTEDPSQSKTELYVEEGTIAGQVKRLQNGSQYDVNTPNASAGIRGTDYVVTVVISGGQLSTVITNASGDVVAVAQGNPIGLSPGESVTITANRVVDPNTGTVTYDVTDIGTPGPATADEIQTANDAVDQINDATVAPVPSVPTATPGTEGETPVLDIDPGINVSPAGG